MDKCEDFSKNGFHSVSVITSKEKKYIMHTFCMVSTAFPLSVAIDGAIAHARDVSAADFRIVPAAKSFSEPLFLSGADFRRQ